MREIGAGEIIVCEGQRLDLQRCEEARSTVKEDQLPVVSADWRV